MTCLEAQDLLAGFVAQALPEASRAAVSAHVAACPSCQDAARRVRTAWEFLGGLEFPPPPLDLRARLAAVTVPALAPPPPPPAPPRRWRGGIVLALLVLGAVPAALWFRGAFRKPVPPPPAAPPPAPDAPALTPWSHGGEGVLQLVAVPGAEIWAASGSEGMLDEAAGRLHLVEGTVWGHPLAGEMLRLDVAGWPVTVTRGTFTAEGFGGTASLTCHEGFLRIDLKPEPLAVPEGTTVLLMEGKPPLGPRPSRSLYPGSPGRP